MIHLDNGKIDLQIVQPCVLLTRMSMRYLRTPNAFGNHQSVSTLPQYTIVSTLPVLLRTHPYIQSSSPLSNTLLTSYSPTRLASSLSCLFFVLIETCVRLLTFPSASGEDL